MGPNESVNSIPEFRVALRDSLNVGVFSPPQGTLRELLASRSVLVFSSPDTWAKLQDWLIIVDDLGIDSRHLERNREEDFMAGVIRLGIPLSTLVMTPKGVSPAEIPLSLPESKFDVDLSALLRDPGMETVFTMRSIRTQLLLDSHKSALLIADQIIEQLGDVNYPEFHRELGAIHYVNMNAGLRFSSRGSQDSAKCTIMAEISRWVAKLTRGGFGLHRVSLTAPSRKTTGDQPVSDDNQKEPKQASASIDAEDDQAPQENAQKATQNGPKFTKGPDPLAGVKKGVTDTLAGMEGKTVSMKLYVGSIIGVIVLMLLARCGG